MPTARSEFQKHTAGPTLDDAEFETLRRIIFETSGISMTPAKRQLVSSRLARRLRMVGCQSYSEYIEYLQRSDPTGEERQNLVNSITTNKTDFFREPHHFDFLRDVAIPYWRSRSGSRRIRIWSAGCSTGPEPYSIAMTLLEHLAPAGLEFELFATDIDTEVLAKAKNGIYERTDAAPVPNDWLKKYFLQGTGNNSGRLRVRPEVRDRIAFQQLNLNHANWDIPSGLDAIFCRNVVIYFDRPTQQRLFERYSNQLASDGYLFIGHAECLHGVTERFVPLGGTIYRPLGAQTISGGSGIFPEGTDSPIVVGEMFASQSPAIVRTVLGSCVAACLFDPVAQVGGMNHFLLPEEDVPDSSCARFGVNAMELLINRIVALGGDRRRLRAKVFGGGRVIGGDRWTSTVGERNSRFVRSYLQSAGIPIDGQQLGGTTGLIVRFQTNTGRAWIKQLPDTRAAEVAAYERRFASQIVTSDSNSAGPASAF